MNTSVAPIQNIYISPTMSGGVPGQSLSPPSLNPFDGSSNNTGISMQMIMALMQLLMNLGSSGVAQDRGFPQFGGGAQDLGSPQSGMSMRDAMAVFSDQTNNIWANNTTGDDNLLSREYLESIADGTAKGNFTDQEVAAVKTFLASPSTYEKIETAAYGGTKPDGDIAFADIEAARAQNSI